MTGARAQAAARRRQREHDILAATRELFDANGVRDAQIEDIARAVGVNRAIIYRHFTGKEELFALTLVGYLDELAAQLNAVAPVDGSVEDGAAAARLADLIGVFVDFGVAHPAFVDCAQALMRRTGPELLDEISEGAMFRLGRAIAGCLKELTTLLDEGQRRGEFREIDSALLANHMYASGLGALQLARVGMLVREAAPGVPEVVPLSPDQVRSFLVATARALAVR
ncbi:TetR/AcrR family transcriptional regulator [Nocardioides terrisoli]|uniref:TetR/AcrR family transcriptional regulator n=1 Tax=Nocardioides terrisoli TaxID=3388267 RepID=UPI00287BBB32|nr:helix-turn-helix domain-containing protein [Nocardioides marmorisolisilvae]